MSTTAEVLSAIYAETGGTDPFGGTLQEAIDITWANMQAFYDDLAPSAVSTFQASYSDYPTTTEVYEDAFFGPGGEWIYDSGPPDYVLTGASATGTGVNNSPAQPSVEPTLGSLSSPDGSVIPHPTYGDDVPTMLWPGTWEIRWTITPSAAGAASRPLSAPPEYADGPWWSGSFYVSQGVSVTATSGGSVTPNHYKELNDPGDIRAGAHTVENWVSGGSSSGTETVMVSPYFALSEAEYIGSAPQLFFDQGRQCTIDVEMQLVEAWPMEYGTESDADRVESVIAAMWNVFQAYRQWWS